MIAGKILHITGNMTEFAISGPKITVLEMQAALPGAEHLEFTRLYSCPKGMDPTQGYYMMVSDKNAFIKIPRPSVNTEASMLAHREVFGDVIIVPRRLLP